MALNSKFQTSHCVDKVIWFSMSGQYCINRYNGGNSCLESLFGRIDQYVRILIWKKFGRIDQYVRILIMNQKWWYYSFWMFTKLLGTRLKRLKNCYQIILSTQCECVDSGSDTSVNTVFSLRNWRGNTHLRAFGPSVHIAPPISQTSDRIHRCVLARVNVFSQFTFQYIWHNWVFYWEL